MTYPVWSAAVTLLAAALFFFSLYIFLQAVPLIEPRVPVELRHTFECGPGPYGGP